MVLDLDGDGVELVSLEDSTAFYDIDGDGYRERMGWVSPDDGLLAYDRNGDGATAGRDELSFVDYVAGARTDLEGLRHFDSNGDGRLDASDAEWGRFRVWRDLDQDGESASGELRTLAEAGVRSIGLTSDGEVGTVAGNRIFGEGRYTDGEGVGSLYDVGLRYSAYGLREESDGGLTVSLGGSGRVYLAGTETGVRVDATALGVVGVFGHDGSDHLVAGGVEGKALVGGGGADTLEGGHGGDVLHGGEGADRLSGGSAGDVLSGDGGADWAVAVARTLHGHGGDDVLLGGEGADRLEGGSGEDVLSGGGGADALLGGAGDDVYVFGRGDGRDTIEDRVVVAGSQREGGTADVLFLSGALGIGDVLLRLSGGALEVALKDPETPDAGFDALADRVTVRGWGSTHSKVETLAFGDGSRLSLKELVSSYGVREGGSSVDLVGAMNAAYGAGKLAAGGNAYLGGAGGDVLVGGAGSDVLRGRAGSDVLVGGAGSDHADALTGNAGSNSRRRRSSRNFRCGGSWRGLARVRAGTTRPVFAPGASVFGSGGGGRGLLTGRGSRG